MENEIISEESKPEEVVEKIASFALSQEDSSIADLRRLLSFRFNFFGESNLAVPRLAARALLQKGKLGVQVLSNSALEASFDKGERLDVGVALEALWHGAHGQLPPKGLLLDVDFVPPLDSPPSSDVVEAARQSFHEIVEESQFNEDLFEKLLLFQFQAIMSVASFKDEIPPEEKKAATDFMRSVVFEVFAEPAIKITRRLITTFGTLVSENRNEEEYQRFLTKHPVFIDPLASEVIPKQKLGLEHITDFVVRRLDNEYILVEIEKPQDAIFTSGNDLTAKFTHAYGQVLDFQEWVDAHGEYARSLMPGIFSPKGVLIIGMRSELTPEQIAKLKRFSINSRSIEVYTFDDLIRKAKDLYENIYKK
jgi:hypothetical protein